MSTQKVKMVVFHEDSDEDERLGEWRVQHVPRIGDRLTIYGKETGQTYDVKIVEWGVEEGVEDGIAIVDVVVGGEVT